MSAAANWHRGRPVDRDAARAALESVRDELDDLHMELLLAAGVIRILVERLVPARVCDPPAERRVLGWLLSGQAKLGDFTELAAYDFADRAHRRIFAWGLEVLEACERGELDGHFWPAALDPSRDTIRRMALLEFEDNRAAARRHPALRTKVRVREYHGDCSAIHAALWRLPYPARLPQREIDLVAALGRAWSVVDQQFNVEPFEVQR
jgi:hypothetical protein